MSGMLTVGQHVIPYELRRSDKACERRIIVTPGHVEVTALASDKDDDIASFLDRKRQWVFNTVREMDCALKSRHAVPRFVTGSKIPYRGRKVRLTVRRTDQERASVTYRGGFMVDLPAWVGGDAEAIVASELRHWLKQRVRRDVVEIASLHARRHALRPTSLRVGNLVNAWGTCGEEGHITINWLLVFAPRRVLQFVIAHELAHLRVRSHGSQFTALLRQIMPEFEDAQAWLHRYQGSLSDKFLST